MNSSALRRIQNWPERAHEAGYSVKALAKSCKVSVRTLERFFLLVMHEPPRRLLERLRLQRALELLRDGSTVKETSACLGYEDPSHFSREFKSTMVLPRTNTRIRRQKRRQHPKSRIRP